MERTANEWVLGCAVTIALAAGCSAPKPAPLHYPPLPSKQQTAPNNDDSARLGGRLYDNFWRAAGVEFVPDDPKTPAPDGKGGPFGNGTLPGADGKPMLNSGHDYRLANLLGWDLHGAAGVSGQKLKASQSVLLPDLHKNTDGREAWRARLMQGEDAIPAYGKTLSAAQIDALVDFMLGVRDGSVPQPDAVFRFDEKAPGFYRLVQGGDAASGRALYAETCQRCHGVDGTQIALGAEKHSLGSFLRADASQAWLKILAGNPGTPMGPQLTQAGTTAELTKALLDLFAATCDRARYPKGAAPDVSDGDARCGDYLK